MATPSGVSLLPAEVSTLISLQAANIIPTVVALLQIIVPIGMACWALGMGIKKAITAIEKKASKAI